MDGRTRGVTVRELGRHAAALLDEVERSGRHVVISRYGRAVAFLGPIPEDYVPTAFDCMHVAPRFQQMAGLAAEEAEAGVTHEEIAELDERERFMLSAIVAATPHWWLPTSKEELNMATPRRRLEERDLIISRAGVGWKPTARGISAAARM